MATRIKKYHLQWLKDRFQESVRLSRFYNEPENKEMAMFQISVYRKSLEDYLNEDEIRTLSNQADG